MKTPFALFFMLLVSFALVAQEKGPVISFENVVHDFGTIKEGEVKTYVFNFTNTGDAPLIVSHITPSCGCTTPEWSRDPIMPGGTGTITAKFDSKGRPGGFHNTITITTNQLNSPRKVVFIRGLVVK